MPENPRATLRIAGHPRHPMLVPLPIGFLVGAFLSDAAYVLTSWASWAYFSTWLIAAGIATALLAAGLVLACPRGADLPVTAMVSPVG